MRCRLFPDASHSSLCLCVSVMEAPSQFFRTFVWEKAENAEAPAAGPEPLFPARKKSGSHERGEAHFAELHPAVIALEHDRARALLIGVQSPARYPGHLTVVDDLGAV